MSQSGSISPSFLRKKSDMSEFLNSRRNLTNAFGRDGSLESDYIKADDNPNRSYKAFRGIGFLNPSPFGTGPLKDFRGIAKNKFNGFVNPNVYVNDGAIDNRYQIEPGQAVRDDKDVDKMDYGKVKDSVYLRQHPAAAGLINGDNQLRNEFNDDTLDSNYDMDKKISGIAAQRLNSSTPLDEDYLTNHPDESKLIALNIGGTADVLNENPDVADNLAGQTRNKYSEKIRSEMADKVSSKLNSATGLDKKFFEENPEAAVYLNSRPGEIEMLNQRPSEAKNFKQHYSAFEQTQEDETLAKARNSLSSQGDFTANYLDNDKEFAADIAVDDVLKQEDSLADNIINHDTLNDKSDVVNDSYDGHISTLASNAIGDSNAFNRDYFIKHPELAMAVHDSPRLSAGLKNAVNGIERFFGLPEGSSGLKRNIEGAMHAFSSGYPLRNSGLVDLWT